VKSYKKSIKTDCAATIAVPEMSIMSRLFRMQNVSFLFYTAICTNYRSCTNIIVIISKINSLRHLAFAYQSSNVQILDDNTPRLQLIILQKTGA
jgi:hypothetical protein